MRILASFIPFTLVSLYFCSLFFRSANYNNETLDCSISDMDRHTIVGSGSFKRSENIDFLENNCVDDPVRLCEFQKMEGRILKTVDSVFQEIESLDECKQLCLEAPYR